MADGSSKLTWREIAINALQRQLQWCEIEVRRVKAALARLAADHNDEVADELAQQLSIGADYESMESDSDREFAFVDSAVRQVDCAVALSASPMSRPGCTAKEVKPDLALVWSHDEPASAETGWGSLGDAMASEGPRRQGAVKASKSRLHRLGLQAKVTPLLCSSVLHSVIVLLLLFGVSRTVAKFESHKMTLVTTPLAIEEDVPVISGDLGVEQVQFTSAEMQDSLSLGSGMEVADMVTADFTAVEGDGGGQAIGSFGQIDSLPSDFGTLITGAGTESSGKGVGTGRGNGSQEGSGGKAGGGRRGGSGQGGGVNSTIFFGTKSKGDRFVFVIDNSSSMKGGRLDLARAELVRTVESLSPKQSFYVIFVSDQPYPMFYPQPELDLVAATPANIRRLIEWLPRAMLASGKNRELIKAMDMAAALQPHAIYLLWDGDLKYSDAVRLDVMTHLTAPGQWNFTVHTIGFNITSADSQQNLTAIAQAHGGVFRRVDLPAAGAK